MWYYQDKPFEPSPDEIKSWAGFVYEITEKSTGKKYIGKKGFWQTRKKPPLKGKTRKRTVITESDWRMYYGSNEEIKALIEQQGGSDHHREILRLCETKGEMSYFEAKMQFDRDVLLRDDYYNGIIQCRINHTHVKNLKKT